MAHIVDRKLWLNADKSKVVEDGDASAAFLFAAPGDEVSDEDAKLYGLKAKAAAANKEAAAPPNKGDSH